MSSDQVAVPAPELRLYDTLSREKRLFRPLDANNVRMYVCGPTVYDFAHIGNARPIIVFDVLFRLLRHLYGVEHVTYARNITDVDDKINARAARDFPGLALNEAIRRVTETTEAQFREDVDALGCLRPTVEPRATEHIAEMRDLIERLIVAGNAYVAEDHVLFDVTSMPDYGALARRSLDEMVAGARVDVAPYKRGAMDFVLWKPSNQAARSAGSATGSAENREPSWPSPAGIAVPGRPGWHLECSAMADRWLWEEARASLSPAGLANPHQFDIHGGGVDLVFPHHENEIAQSRCAFGTPAMAQIWMHNGFLQVEGEKMSKSRGNFVTIRELLRGWWGRPWSGRVVRLAMLETHYRQPLDWTLERVEAARAELGFWALELALDMFSGRDRAASAWSEEPAPSQHLAGALSDDLNTPEALGSLRQRFNALKEGNDDARIELLRDVLFLGLLDRASVGAHRLSLARRDFSGVPIGIANEATRLAWNAKIHFANRDKYMLESTTKRLRELGIRLVSDQSGGMTIEYDGISSDTIETRVAARVAARRAKNFAEADRIRDELAALGIALKDGKDPTTGEPVTTWEVDAGERARALTRIDPSGLGTPRVGARGQALSRRGRGNGPSF